MESALLVKELLEAVGSINRKDILSKINISVKGEERFLMILSEMGGVATPSAIAGYSDFTPARLSAIMKSLESKGFIETKPDEKDKRYTIVEITENGSKRVAERKEEIVMKSFRVIEQLGEEDATEFVRLTKKMINILADDTAKGKGSE